MSTSWKPAGESADFSSDITTIIKDFFTGANGWNGTTGVVAETDIVFGTDWWNDYGDYQIHFRDPRYASTPAENGWTRFEFHTFVDIHIFVRRATEDRPDQLFQIKREVMRIVGQNPTGVGSGVQWIRWAAGGDLREVTEPDGEKTTWHLVGTLECFYHMVNSA